MSKIEEQNEDPVYGYYDHAKRKLKPVARSVELNKRGLVEDDVEEESGFLTTMPRGYTNKFNLSISKDTNPANRATQYARQRRAKEINAQIYFKSHGLDDMVARNKEPRAAAMSTNIHEDEQLDEAPRVKLIKARIRGGKVQRRKKVSNVQGFTLKQGRLTRMSVTERRNRKMGQRRGKIKRRARMTQTLMKRARSMRRRKALGI